MRDSRRSPRIRETPSRQTPSRSLTHRLYARELRAMASAAFNIRLEIDGMDTEALKVTRLDGREAISELFDFRIEAVWIGDGAPSFEDLGALECQLVFSEHGEEVRRIFGMIVEATQRLDSARGQRRYRLRIAPLMWRLSLIRTQDVALNISIPDVCIKSLSQVGLASLVTNRLEGQYPVREFIVKFAESDLEFVRRLTDHLGISFFLRAASGSPEIVFTDHADGFDRIEEAAIFCNRPEDRGVIALEVTNRPIPRMFAAIDYNYRQPEVDILAVVNLAEGLAGGVIEFAPNAHTTEEAMVIAKARAERQLVLRNVFAGTSNLATFRHGARVRLEGDLSIGDVDLLLIEVTHEAVLPLFMDGGAPPSYKNTFRATLASVCFRPERTPRPRMSGVSYGMIEGGGSGELATLDEHGRYTVHMMFDVSSTEARSSLPIRMAQASAGPGYGIHFPLRPGTEVLIAFVNGDPDRPLIIGAVPNAVTPSPVNEKNAKLNRIVTQSGIRLEFDDLA
ncbi:MAG: type VI secretion system tip protein VgrG [Myxococcales bacterium]|nr:type VI secretion system tip protein VgrG [Myxococcales bacterium]